jgi:nucleoside-diphosphate-sugar epimerase
VIIAITGGSGFVGRNLIARHIARGDEVRFLTRHSPKQAIAGAIPVIGDIKSLTPNVGFELLRGTDVLYHCAAELRDTRLMYDTNVLGTQNLLSMAIGKVKRWVQLSSTGVYGNKPSQNVNESTTINPNNAYEASKAAADELVYAAMAERQLQGLVLRPSNVYGLDMPNQSLFQLIDMIRRGWFFFIGEQGATVNYISVHNVVDALVLCGTAALPSNGRTYIVSDSCSLETLVGIIATALGVPAPTRRLPESLVRMVARLGDFLPPFPLRSTRVDALTYRHVYLTDRIESELAYRHAVSLAAGISELVRHAK